MYHNLRYNTTINNPCSNNGCSHLCLLVPGGHRCSCPDLSSGFTTIHKTKAEIICDAASERPRPEPRICTCQNGGLCRESDGEELLCECLDDFHGQYCEVHVGHSRTHGASNTAAIIIPIVVILLVVGAATGVWLFLRKRPL